MFTDMKSQGLTLSGRVTNYPHNYVSLYQVNDGDLKLYEVIPIQSDSLFRFDVPQGEAGFYYLGVDDQIKSVFAEIYIPQGQASNLLVDNKVVAEESVPEPALAAYQKKWDELKRIHQTRYFKEGRDTANIENMMSTYDEDYLKFIEGVQSSNHDFNAIMRLKAEVEYELFWLRSFSMATEAASQKMLQQSVFKRLLNKRFDSAKYLLVKDGSHYLNSYPSFYARANGHRPEDYFKYSMSLFNNDKLKGQLLKDHIIMRKKSGKDYDYLMETYGHNLVTESQKKAIAAYEKEIKKFAADSPAIDFRYADASGQVHALSDYKGKVVLVDVWATWCAPCKAEIPHLEKVIDHYETNPDIVFISVSIDKQKDKAKWEKFIEEHGMKGIQLITDKGFKSQIMLDYEITGVPRFMLFNKEGNIVSVNAARPSNPRLKEMIDELL